MGARSYGPEATCCLRARSHAPEATRAFCRPRAPRDCPRNIQGGIRLESVGVVGEGVPPCGPAVASSAVLVSKTVPKTVPNGLHFEDCGAHSPRCIWSLCCSVCICPTCTAMRHGRSKGRMPARAGWQRKLGRCQRTACTISAAKQQAEATQATCSWLTVVMRVLPFARASRQQRGTRAPGIRANTPRYVWHAGRVCRTAGSRRQSAEAADGIRPYQTQRDAGKEPRAERRGRLTP